MRYHTRILDNILRKILQRGKSVLLFGSRQTGKTTLVRRIENNLFISLVNPSNRLRYEKAPNVFMSEIEALSQSEKKLPLVIIDEIQKVPILMDAIQDLIDRNVAQFILTGSSARKLKRSSHANLLPGRVIPLYLDPFSILEISDVDYTLDGLLLDGSLPEISLEKNIDDREQLLNAYVSIYLEEEIRAEALVRNVGSFSRFLELAAIESGNIINYSNISQELGIAYATIVNYFQILEDCLIAHRIDPLTKSKTRKRLIRSPKYLLFDLGVRRIACNEGRKLSKTQLGRLFEQFVGLELLKNIRMQQERYSVHYWRDSSGVEIDWVLEGNNKYIPIEVKWTESPSINDAKHLRVFLQEYKSSSHGFIICRTPRPMKITDNVTALPWAKLLDVFDLLQ